MPCIYVYQPIESASRGVPFLHTCGVDEWYVLESRLCSMTNAYPCKLIYNVSTKYTIGGHVFEDDRGSLHFLCLGSARLLSAV